jgi:hypothetical protein
MCTSQSNCRRASSVFIHKALLQSGCKLQHSKYYWNKVGLLDSTEHVLTSILDYKSEHEVFGMLPEASKFQGFQHPTQKFPPLCIAMHGSMYREYCLCTAISMFDA